MTREFAHQVAAGNPDRQAEALLPGRPGYPQLDGEGVAGGGGGVELPAGEVSV